jgi:hypothetical protein
MPQLANFGFNDLMTIRGKLRSAFAGDEPATFEAAANVLARLFYRELTDGEGRPACALVRVYKTHLYRDLDAELQAFARNIESGADSMPQLRCLTLVATAGDEPAWNSRHQSRSHKAIPLSSEQAVAQAPMVSQLISQLGVSVAAVLRPDPALLIDMRDRSQNVFYVPRALGSPYIVAQQDFVIPYGIESVIGFGGILASGDLVTAILFSKVPISAAVADHFKVVGLNFKLAMLPYVRKPLFEQARN